MPMDLDDDGDGDDAETLEDLIAQARDIASRITSEAEAVRALGDEEQEKFNNMPEGLQQADNGQAMEAAGEHLIEAADALDDGRIGDALDALGNIEL